MCAHRPEITGDYWTPFQDTHLMFIEPIIAKKAHKNVDSTIHQLRFGNPYNKPLKSFLARNIGGGAGFWVAERWRLTMIIQARFPSKCLKSAQHTLLKKQLGDRPFANKERLYYILL